MSDAIRSPGAAMLIAGAVCAASVCDIAQASGLHAARCAVVCVLPVHDQDVATRGSWPTLRVDHGTDPAPESAPVSASISAPAPTPESESESEFASAPLWLTYPAAPDIARGRRIVLIAADQEYRSEQAMPMLARILATHHGFDCTVLFSVNADGDVDPTLPIRWQDKTIVHDIPGLEQLEGADLLIVFSRLITLPEAQVAHIVRYLDSGRPVIGIRTANHGFLESFLYEIDGQRVRFGEDILGGSFRSHHGNWHADSTRGIIVAGMEDHPILRGVNDVWGPSDVYRTFDEGAGLRPDCTPLLLGQPLLGRSPDDAPNPEKIPLPIAWTTTWTGSTGATGRVFHVTMGSAKDYECADLRRLTVNAAYWCLGLDDAIAADSSVEIVGSYAPLPSGFDYEKLGVKPKPVAEYR